MALRFLNPRNRWARLALKAGLFIAVVTFVLYPNPRLLVRNIRHWSNLSALPEPASPALDELSSEFSRRLAAAGGASGAGSSDRALRIVDELVREALPYEWDWNTWGVADYIPTVDEAMAKGREDCDGRAVIAASLLQRLGYQARLVSDGSHMWVWTPEGESMSPMATASGHRLMTAGAKGTDIDMRAVVGWRALLIDWPTNFAYGVAVFPAWRELLILLAAWLLWLRPGDSGRAAAIGLGLALSGWLVLRIANADPWDRQPLWAWAGLALTASGGVALWLTRRGRDGEVAGLEHKQC